MSNDNAGQIGKLIQRQAQEDDCDPAEGAKAFLVQNRGREESQRLRTAQQLGLLQITGRADVRDRQPKVEEGKTEVNHHSFFGLLYLQGLPLERWALLR
jgi:hypothetical protein